ncbi:MAG: hypothetical protein AAF630_06250 [Cyanobacteria bacterium P01_C01_bin.38]
MKRSIQRSPKVRLSCGSSQGFGIALLSLAMTQLILHTHLVFNLQFLALKYYQSPIPNSPCPITNYQLPTTNYQLPMPHAPCPTPNF